MTGYRLPTPDTAFALRGRRQREKQPDHLAFIRRLRCVGCGADQGSEAAHVRMASPLYGKRDCGKGEKPDDKWSVPLCAECHRLGPDSQHAMSEREYWARIGIDPVPLALALWAHTGDDLIGEIIIGRHLGLRR